MASLFPTYLYQRNAIWWYRQRLPNRLINRTLRVSLRTADVTEARTLAVLLNSFIRRRTADLIGNCLRTHHVATALGGVTGPTEPNDYFSGPETIPKSTHEESQMVSTYETIKNQARKIIHHYHSMELADWQSRPRTMSEYELWIDLLHLFKSQAIEASRLNDLTQSQQLVQDYFEDTTSSPPSPPTLDKLVRKVCDLVPSIYQALLNNKPLESIEELLQVAEPTPKQGTEPASEKVLSELMDAYLSENQLKGWKTRTIKQYEHSLFIALHHLGDGPVSSLNRTQGRELRATLVRLAKGKTQADITAKGLMACLTDNDAHRISVTTANNHMNRLREFFRWCESMGFIERNPLPDDNLPAPKSAKIAKRDPITDHEAKQIFSHRLFVEQRGVKTKQIQHASHFWLPLIAAYSGMRLGEISQLQVSNIRQISGINCFVVERSTDDQYIKTPNAVRAIPIHNELLRIGFLDFVDYIRSKGGKRLFNNIKLIQGNYSNKPSEWFIKNFRDALCPLPKNPVPKSL